MGFSRVSNVTGAKDRVSNKSLLLAILHLLEVNAIMINSVISKSLSLVNFNTKLASFVIPG